MKPRVPQSRPGGPLFAAGIGVVVSPDGGVYVEMLDENDVVIAVAGMKLCAATLFQDQMVAACTRATLGQTASGAVH
jgi:hypothetical protein